MSHKAFLLAAVFALVATLPLRADDHEKAQKEITKISSLAVDSNCRSVTNRTEAEMFKVSRADLVTERKDMNLNYGSLFLAHELANSGSNMKDIAAQLKAGKTMDEIADAQHANWKQIAGDAKKLNKKIDDNMVKRFNDEKKDTARDAADNYNPQADKVAADSDVSKQEVAEAQTRYQHLHELSAQNNLGGDAATKPLAGTPPVSK
jgi:hypothetical protein